MAAESSGGALVSSRAMSDTPIRVTKQGLIEAVRSAWWALPISIILITGLLFAQASRFQYLPAEVETIRRLEGIELLSSLVALEIDAQAFAPLLSLGGELIKFNSSDTQEKRNKDHGFDVRLSVSQVPGDYDVINREVTERNTVYSFVSVGTGIFVFTCTEASEKDCSRALDLGVAEFEESRSNSIRSSIAAVADTLDERLSAVRQVITESSDPTALLAQRQLEIELASQVDVLRSASKESVFELSLIDERVEERSATISSVDRSTYLLGVLLGALVGGLIILQFAVLRSRRS